MGKLFDGTDCETTTANCFTWHQGTKVLVGARKPWEGSWRVDTQAGPNNCRAWPQLCDTFQPALSGWRERTTWEGGLRQTVDWYLTHGFKDYWDKADVEAALEPHPIIHPQMLLALGTPAL